MAEPAAPARGELLQPGERFGQLTVVGFARPSRYGNVWRLRCECGAQVEKSLGQIRRALKLGNVPRCRACAQTGRRRPENSRRLRAKWMVERFERTGSLYTADEEQGMEADIRTAIAAELGFFPDGRVPPGRYAALPAGEWTPPTAPTPRSEAYYQHTLGEVADELGCSRERVRQIQEEALAKLRRLHFRAEPVEHDRAQCDDALERASVRRDLIEVQRLWRKKLRLQAAVDRCVAEQRAEREAELIARCRQQLRRLTLARLIVLVLSPQLRGLSEGDARYEHRCRLLLLAGLALLRGGDRPFERLDDAVEAMVREAARQYPAEPRAALEGVGLHFRWILTHGWRRYVEQSERELRRIEEEHDGTDQGSTEASH